MGSSNLTIKTHLKSEKEIASRLKIEKDGKATEFLRNEVYRLSIPYVPRGSGRLSTDHTFPDAHTIKYTSPYAHYHYKGILYLTKSGSSWAKRGEKKFPSGKKMHYTRGGPEWDKRMLSNRKGDLVRSVENYIKNGG